MNSTLIIEFSHHPVPSEQRKAAVSVVMEGAVSAGQTLEFCFMGIKTSLFLESFIRRARRPAYAHG
ncbi:hypothetical protein HPP92_011261 [Vanilla planifolia]|uniref:Uncharacterized protein n=1 Tax=Vanilla planifolia TaxID=51239 RepID=A0A835QYP9_VANPL|nr:hypothetical protein HPP92_011261 [Vanilla planifolia]